MSSQPNRLAQGGLIDRSKTFRFSFDGETLTGYRGDTLASALLANGVRLVGRSFKYHRPRGILTAGSEEPNALVELRNGRAARAQYPRDHHRALRRAVRREPEPLAIAEIRCAGGEPDVLADLRRRLLLQDLHVARRLLGEAVRAGDPPRRGAWPCRGRAGPRPLRQGQRLLRRAGDRRRACRACPPRWPPRVRARE